MNTKNISPAAQFFNDNGWVKIQKVIDKDMAFFCYNYIKFAVTRLNLLDENLGYGNYDEEQWGTFNDKQAPGDFSRYGDLFFDTLMTLITAKVEEGSGLKLVPTYSYHRLYTKGTELTRHKDRPSCEISTTLCLGYDTENLKDKNWNWPMFIGPKNGEIGDTGIPVYLNPGDMIIYKGCEVEHWREPLLGNNHAQVFLHYNEKDGKNNITYDKRPFIGLPKDIFSIKKKYTLEEKEDKDKDQIVYD